MRVLSAGYGVSQIAATESFQSVGFVLPLRVGRVFPQNGRVSILDGLEARVWAGLGRLEIWPKSVRVRVYT